jgi:hypothetical protein
MTTTTTYNGFKIKTDDADANALAGLKQTVDDYQTGFKHTSPAKCMRVDAARIAMAHRGACRMLRPMTVDQRNWLKRVTMGLNVESVESALMPNRIEAKHVTGSSRVRNLVHGGITGLLAARLMNDSSQVERTSRTVNSECIIRRVNGESGCEHVKWSIPEFQFIHNIGVKYFKTGRNPFAAMSHDETLAQLKVLDTLENRQAFLEECKSMANAPNHSRIKRHEYADDARSDVGSDVWWCCRRRTTAMVIANDWIAHFLNAFSKACLFKMDKVSDDSASKLTRCVNLIELYRFISGRMDWIITDPNMRQITNLHHFWEKYMERISYMAGEGVEHAALMLAKYVPEMMTPELHCDVSPVADIYRVPEMQISNDDALFAPLKATCEALLPDAVAGPDAVAVPIYRYDAYSDYDDDYCDDDDDDDDDDVQG